VFRVSWALGVQVSETGSTVSGLLGLPMRIMARIPSYDP
jgi:hypothetical protein